MKRAMTGEGKSQSRSGLTSLFIKIGIVKSESAAHTLLLTLACIFTAIIIYYWVLDLWISDNGRADNVEARIELMRERGAPIPE